MSHQAEFNTLKMVYSGSNPGHSNNYEIINNFHFFATSYLQLYKGLPKILEGNRVNMIIQTNIYMYLTDRIQYRINLEFARNQELEILGLEILIPITLREKVLQLCIFFKINEYCLVFYVFGLLHNYNYFINTKNFCGNTILN